MADAIVSGAISVCKILHTCELCGKGFYPKRTSNTRFCGRGCGLQWSSFKTWVKSHGGRVWVRVRRRKPRPKAEPKDYYEPVIIGRCRNCGKDFDRRIDGATRFMCSEACATYAAARAKRAARKKRKAIERGARTAVRVDPIDVFERDAWRCQICGRKTPQSKRGTYHPTAPELDHIVALANGGTHTWDNVQCACRSCNARKGATDFGQLHLVPAG